MYAGWYMSDEQARRNQEDRDAKFRTWLAEQPCTCTVLNGDVVITCARCQFELDERDDDSIPF